jgi:hypothetical protein
VSLPELESAVETATSLKTSGETPKKYRLLTSDGTYWLFQPKQRISLALTNNRVSATQLGSDEVWVILSEHVVAYREV